MTAKRQFNARTPRLRVIVTEELIELSAQRDSSHCMIAEGVKYAARAAGYDPKHISVDIQTIRWTNPDLGLRYTYLTPRRGQEALVLFDQGQKPEPFSMEIRGGQVTVSGTQGRRRQGGYIKPPTEAQIAAGTENLKRARGDNVRDLPEQAASEAAGNGVTGKARLDNFGEGHKVPEKIGGRTPPVPPRGRRRQFGVRAFER